MSLNPTSIVKLIPKPNLPPSLFYVDYSESESLSNQTWLKFRTWFRISSKFIYRISNFILIQSSDILTLFRIAFESVISSFAPFTGLYSILLQLNQTTKPLCHSESKLHFGDSYFDLGRDSIHHNLNVIFQFATISMCSSSFARPLKGEPNIKPMDW